jgi:hypothetical protein
MVVAPEFALLFTPKFQTPRDLQEDPALVKSEPKATVWARGAELKPDELEEPDKFQATSRHQSGLKALERPKMIQVVPRIQRTKWLRMTQNRWSDPECPEGA